MSFSDSIFPSTSGIYLIRNTISGKRYVGSAVNLQKRRYEHLRTLRKGTHKNPILQASFNAHGEDAFETEILELVLIPELLTAREQIHIDTLQPEFNVLKLAGNNLGLKFSDESRQRLSEQRKGRKQSPETIEKRVAKIRGMKRSPEYLAKRIGKKRSEETRARISASRKGWVPGEETRAKWSAQRTGRQTSEDTKAKIAEIARTTPNKGRFKKGEVPPNSGQFKKGQPSPMKGKHPSAETRAKQSAAKKNNPEYIAMLVERNKSRARKNPPIA